eukprot:gene11810-13034_t
MNAQYRNDAANICSSGSIKADFRRVKSCEGLKSVPVEEQPDEGGQFLASTLNDLKLNDKANDRLKMFYCSACSVDLNSMSQARQHVLGTRHAKKCKDVHPLKRKILEAPSAATQHHGKAGRKNFFCVSCDLELNSSTQAEAHLNSTRHKNNDTCSQEFLASNALSNHKAENNSELRCILCNVFFTSHINEQDHYSGKKHAAKLREKEMINLLSRSTSSEEQPSYPVQIEASPPASPVHSSIDKDDETFIGIQPSCSSGTRETGQALLEKPNEQSFLQCQLCRLSVNSESQLNAHYVSKKHLQAVDQMTKQGCGRGRAVMLNRLRQLSDPGQRDGVYYQGNSRTGS